MRIAPSPKSKKVNRKKPQFKWQTGHFAPTQTIRLNLPDGFLLLCKLWGITPRLLLSNFMDNLSCGSWMRQGRDAAKVHLKNYALEMGYGSRYYTPEDMQQMFTQLNAIGMLFPFNANIKILNLHVRWRKKYYGYWYNQWKNKYKKSKKPGIYDEYPLLKQNP